MADGPETIETLELEARRFPPPEAFVAAARVGDASIYETAAADREGYWVEQAKQLDWIEPWTQVCDRSNPPFYKWFVDGKLNVSVNCLDRHLAEHGDKVAYHWEGEPGDTQAITYADLHARVCRFANALRAMGVGKGDRVAIYMGMVPELPVAMLACARIGAGAHGGLRRLLGRGPERPDHRLRGDGLHHRRRGLARRQERSRSRRTPTTRSSCCPTIEHCVVVQAHRRRHRLDRGPRRLVPRGLRGPAGHLRARGHGRRGPAVHPLHLGDDRQAEGHRPHHGRLPDRGRRHPPHGLRHPRRRRLLVRGRHRLGHRPQLHRLRPALPTARPGSSTRALRTSPTSTACGTSSSATRRRSSTPRRRRSAPS